MHKKLALNFSFCSAIILAAFTLIFSQKQDSIDIPTVLREVQQKSDENWRKVIVEYPHYTYKWRKVWRTAGKNGRTEEKSELYELFNPTKCPVKKCRGVNILLAEDGKPLAAEKIEKQRIKAGEKLERIEGNTRAQALPSNQDFPLEWMRFSYSIRPLFSSEARQIVLIDGQEVLEKCEFFGPTHDLINGRKTIVLSFQPRADAVFGTTTIYMPQTEGKIWIDAADKVLIRLAIWQKGTKFAETTSSYLFEHAALARDMTRTQEGVWFPRLGRINGLNYPNLFTEMKSDFSIENFDHHYFKTEIQTIEIHNSVEN
ncbi:MAG: hypothetical protein ACRD6X_06505 [Pyrinomonadaceae bacterium]